MTEALCSSQGERVNILSSRRAWMGLHFTKSTQTAAVRQSVDYSGSQPLGHNPFGKLLPQKKITL